MGARAVRIGVFLGGDGVEGGLDGPREPASTWRQAQALGRVEPTGIGIDLLDDPGEVLEILRRLPIDDVMLRISWARCAPSDESLDERALGRYRALVDALRAQGHRVGLVLTDGTAPAWLGPEAWLKPATPDRFARFACAAVDQLAPDGPVVTVEEPGLWALAGWVLAAAPPFRVAGLLDALAALDGLLAADLKASMALGDRGAELIGSIGVLGSVEQVMLGQADPGLLPRSVAIEIERRTPDRARRLAATGAASSRGVCVVGQSPAIPGWLGGMGSRLLSASSPPPSAAEPVAHGVLAGASAVLHRFVVADIDQHARCTPTHRDRRSELTSIATAIMSARADGASVDRLVLGELTDRWRFGSFGAREGLVGVDRTRGRRGFELRDTDACGCDPAEILSVLGFLLQDD